MVKMLTYCLTAFERIKQQKEDKGYSLWGKLSEKQCEKLALLRTNNHVPDIRSVPPPPMQSDFNPVGMVRVFATGVTMLIVSILMSPAFIITGGATLLTQYHFADGTINTWITICAIVTGHQYNYVER